jgi:hypothetical protein
VFLPTWPALDIVEGSISIVGADGKKPLRWPRRRRGRPAGGLSSSHAVCKADTIGKKRLDASHWLPERSMISEAHLVFEYRSAFSRYRRE